MFELKVDFFRVLYIELRKNIIIILMVTLAALFAGLALTEYVTNQYTFWATTSVYVTNAVNQGQLNSNNILENYSDIAKSRRVCERAKQLLGDTPLTAEQIRRMLTIEISSNSRFMSITAYSPNPELSIHTVNAVAKAYIAEMSGISVDNPLEILDFAETASYKSDNMRNKLRVGLTAGTFITICGYIFIKELLSDKIRLISQCAEDEDEILAIIPHARQEYNL